MVTTLVLTPFDYEGSTRHQMQQAGLLRIEQDYKHCTCFENFHSVNRPRYFFADGSSTDCIKAFRKRVYNYIER